MNIPSTDGKRLAIAKNSEKYIKATMVNISYSASRALDALSILFQPVKMQLSSKSSEIDDPLLQVTNFVKFEVRPYYLIEELPTLKLTYLDLKTVSKLV